MGGRPTLDQMTPAGRQIVLDFEPTHVGVKQVRALEIVALDDLSLGYLDVRMPDGAVRQVDVPRDLARRGTPVPGDRLIIYRDGYVSWCPRAVFEGGEYRPIADLATAIARVCHEVNSAICAEFGHDVPPPWDEAAEWQRKSAIDGVMFALANPDATPEQQHEAWREAKWADGWTIGPVKDPIAKEHPCLVEYELLPADQRVKDRTFRAIVAEMARQGLPRVPRFTGADAVEAVPPTT
ncbi:RyR domain-containing protein [Methylobacterium aquaticum]|nr:RyR domain-containing protein [Methylobacterium aquaticum]